MRDESRTMGTDLGWPALLIAAFVGGIAIATLLLTAAGQATLKAYDFTGQTAAAWGQMLGGVLAVAAAFIVARWQQAERDSERRRNERFLAAAKVVELLPYIHAWMTTIENARGALIELASAFGEERDSEFMDRMNRIGAAYIPAAIIENVDMRDTLRIGAPGKHLIDAIVMARNWRLIWENMGRAITNRFNEKTLTSIVAARMDVLDRDVRTAYFGMKAITDEYFAELVPVELPDRDG